MPRYTIVDQVTERYIIEADSAQEAYWAMLDRQFADDSEVHDRQIYRDDEQYPTDEDWDELTERMVLNNQTGTQTLDPNAS